MLPDDLRDRLRRALSAQGRESSDYDLNAGTARPGPETLRPAAVLIGVDVTGPVTSVILTKRSARLRNHPGQIAFPGGRQDPTDASPRAAALREAQEEIGLPAAAVEVLGVLPGHATVTGFAISPVLALVTQTFVERPERGEVDEVFRVPLAFLAERGNYRTEGRRWQGRLRHYYACPYGPYYIWGATARMLLALADRLNG